MWINGTILFIKRTPSDEADLQQQTRAIDYVVFDPTISEGAEDEWPSGLPGP